MAALAFQGVEVQRQGSDKRLAFARLHLRDLALVEHDTADELHIEMAQAGRAHGGFPHQGKRFRQEVIQRFAGGQPCPEGICLGP